MNTIATNSPETILVHVSGDRIGDALLKLPVLRAFRMANPHTHITWVTAKRPSVFAGRLAELSDGLIDEIHQQTGLGLALFGRIPAELAGEYDVVVSTEARWRETLVLKRLASKHFISPAARFLLSTRRPALKASAGSALDQFNALMSLACGKDLTPVIEFELPQRYIERAEILLPRGPRYFGLCPGAGGQSKRWPLEKFMQVSRAVAERGFCPVYFLGPEEAALVETIRAQSLEALFPELASNDELAASPLLTVALAQRLARAVTNDSGGGHLIAAGGKPVITLFGHTNPAKFRSPYCEQVAITAQASGNGVLADIDVAVVLREIDRLALN